MQDSITIPERYRGPPNSGNGGYVGGVFSKLLNPDHQQAVEVTLRSPVPLDRSLQVSFADGEVRVRDGEQLIAEIRQSVIELEIPQTPDWNLVRDSQPRSLSFARDLNEQLPGRQGFHPICFCCGYEHEDGARVFAAPVGDSSSQVAALWETRESWAADDGQLPVEYLWTAMDCPGQFAYMATGIRTGLLGRMTARIHDRPMAGQTLLVTAWPIQVDDRKHYAGAAVFDADGRLFSEAITLWIGRR
ncbi:MAG: hypothetical protein O3B72_11305 [Proteobacteria bacterium]|nr:hypothetical protein [Pseudomonadota bacterium]